MDSIKLWATLKNEPKYVYERAMATLNSISLNDFQHAFDTLCKSNEGCFHWWLFRGDNFDYALVMGFTDTGDGYVPCMKLARQSHHSAMQCDFDYDWEQPQCNDSGDIYDTDTLIETKEELKNCVSDMKNMLKGFFKAERKYNKEI